MGETSIEWTDKTWNPVRGCSRVSPGCVNCYAERQAARFAGESGPFHGFVTRVNGHPAWTGKVELIDKHLEDPVRWKQPKRIFVNSMSDLFHEGLPPQAIKDVFDVMRRAHWHQYQILTKRAARMLTVLRYLEIDPLPNVWLGVSVEDQQRADERIPLLLQTPAAVRFVSYEPALGPVDFCNLPSASGIGRYLDALSNAGVDPGALIPNKLDWIIIGGESGPNARPFDIEWARNTVAQCKSAGVACFVKQLGANPEESISATLEGYEIRLTFSAAKLHELDRKEAALEGHKWMRRIPLNDRKGGDMSEWPEDLRVREFPNSP